MAAHPPLTPFGSALAGALGAVFANATVYPLDTAKTRLQALPQEVLERESAPSTSSSRKDELSLRNLHALPRVLLAKLRKWQLLMLLVRIIKTEGISGAFKGFSASMINTFSQQFAYFFFHTFLRSRALKRRPALSTSSELALGAAAGALAQIFTIPVAVIATRQQLWVEPSPSPADGSSASKQRRAGAPSLLETAHEIIAESGITGLWTGLKPGLVLTANPAITYGVFERLKAWKLARNGAPPGKLTVGEAFWLGVTSKTLATIVTYPYIFAKVRLQAAKPARKAVPPPKGPSYAEIASHDPAPEAPVVAADSHSLDAAEKATAGTAPVAPVQPRGAIALLRQVYKEHGIAGWYQGLGAQIFKAVLCQGILFVSKEQFEGYAWIILTFLEGVRARAGPVAALAKAGQ